MAKTILFPPGPKGLTGAIGSMRAADLSGPRWVTLNLATQEWRWMFYRERWNTEMSQVSLWATSCGELADGWDGRFKLKGGNRQFIGSFQMCLFEWKGDASVQPL
jgi:hypothetical protein